VFESYQVAFDVYFRSLIETFNLEVWQVAILAELKLSLQKSFKTLLTFALLNATFVVIRR